MTFTRIEHVWKLDKNAVSQFVCMITALWGVLCATCNENLSVVGLDRTEADWNVEVNVEVLTRLFVLVNVIVVDRSLVKLEVMYPIQSISHSLVFLTKATSPTFNLSHWPLNYMQPRLTELVHWVPLMNLTSHSLHIRLEVHLVTCGRPVSEVNLTLCQRLIWHVWNVSLSIVPTLRAFLLPIICA